MEKQFERDPFYKLARLFRHDLDTASPEVRASRVVSVLAVVLSIPLVIGGMIWLAAVTDWRLFPLHWPMLLLLAGLSLLFGQLKFYSIADLGDSRGLYGNAVSSLEGVIQWSGLLLFGTPFLWIDLVLTLIRLLMDRSAWRSRDSRWSLAQNMSLSTALVTLLPLIVLQIYHGLGGIIPPAGLSTRMLIAGVTAVTVELALDMALLWCGYLSYTTWALRKTLGPRLLASLPALLFMNLIIPFIANLFAVPLAGIYSAHGLLFYLVFVLAFLLVALLARQMSRSSENSRIQSVQLEKLTTLGRAILASSPDASGLPSILLEHVPAMFTHSRLCAWVNGKTLLSIPEEWSQDEQAAMRAWVERQETTSAFVASEALSWAAGLHHPVITAPILETGSGQSIGGIYVELAELGQTWDRRALERLLPSLEGLAAQIASALHQARVYLETLAHQRTLQELAIARQIQTSFLPRQLPQIPGWQIAASLEPAREMSGDFYDLIPLPQDRLGILIADVADKGIGPALYMALSRTLIRTFAMEHVDHPEKVLHYANKRILQDADYSLFVTTFYGVLDLRTGNLVYANAGHNPPWVFEKGKAEPALLSKTGMALGVDELVRWTKAAVQLTPGSTVFFYTDGATDAQNRAGEMFEEERLRRTVYANRGCPAVELSQVVVQEIERFTAGAPRFDDITLIVIQRELAG
jgi:serine phosphatase RsbU (regulator of sigma subunit)